MGYQGLVVHGVMKHFIAPANSLVFDDIKLIDSLIEVDENTISQPIGRTDKNGSEIYEDHKLKNLLCENGCYDTIYYTPRWDDENLCYMFDCHGYLEERIDYFSNEIVVVDSFRVDDIDFGTLEIMGSIHDYQN